MFTGVCRRLAILVLVLSFLTSSCALCLAADRPFNLPRTERKVLPNGLVVVLMEKRDLPLIDFQLLLPTGSADDPHDKEGLANLTASLLRKGTKGRTAREIADQVDFLGAELSIDTKEDRTVLSLEVMSDDAAFATGLLADMVRNPSFVQGEFDKEKQNVLASLESDKDDLPRYASTGFRRFLLQGHPYAHPAGGYSESVARIERSDVEEFHGRAFTPRGAILAVVGDFSAGEVFRLIRRDFSPWKAGARVVKRALVEPPARIEGRRICLVDKPDATQTQLRIGNVAFARNSAEYFPGLVSSAILGGVFSSRLMTEVRVNRGLTYSIFSRFIPMKEGGVFSINTFTKTETVGEAVSVILEEMDRIVSGGVNEEELEKVKSFLKGQFPLSLEAPEQMANLLLEVEFYGLPADYAARFRQNVDSVTAQNVTEMARRYFETTDLAFLALGNVSEISPQLQTVGKTQTLDMDWKPLGATQ